MDYIKRLDFFYKIKILMVEYMKNDGFNFDFETLKRAIVEME